jgi:hypothetical protein
MPLNGQSFGRIEVLIGLLNPNGGNLLMLLELWLADIWGISAVPCHAPGCFLNRFDGIDLGGNVLNKFRGFPGKPVTFALGEIV